MTDLTYYSLDPRQGNGYHFGRQGLELEISRLTFPSDSLFAALTATLAEQQGPLAAYRFVAPFFNGKVFKQLVKLVLSEHGESTAEELRQQFAGRTPPFKLTSVYPRVGNLPLLPLPQLPIHPGEQELPRKFAKKVRFVSPKIWQQLCAGAKMGKYLAENDEGRSLQDGAVWLTSCEQKHLPEKWRTLNPQALARQQVWHRGSVSRVTLDRATSASTIYQMGRVVFNAGCGLWLGVRYADTGAQEPLEHLLHHLGDRGIGGERSPGYGGFSVRTGHPLQPLPQTHGNGYLLLLSRFLPRKDEMDVLLAELASYQLVSVGGWFQSPRSQALRRKQVHLLAEGSVVGQPADGTLSGKVDDVSPDPDRLQQSGQPAVPHPIYRYGIALAVPVMATAPEAS